MRRRTLLRGAGTAAALGALGGRARGAEHGSDCSPGQPPRGEPRPYDDYAVRAVPADYPSVQAGVDAAEPRDLVLVEPGVYREAVTVDTPRVTVRGRDRNAVVLDGEFERPVGVHPVADDVVVENLTVRHYTQNGVYWTGVRGYRGSYLTAYNNHLYGVYAHTSRHGRFEHSYASGHTDSGFYIGESNPSNAVVTDVVAEHNAIGYSGTNSGGCLTLKDSVWRHNRAGIVPNSLVTGAGGTGPGAYGAATAPQAAMRIENNAVAANHNARAPTRDFGDMAFGCGILAAGGTENVVVGNDVRDHLNFGIGLVLMFHRGQVFLPRGNRVRDNAVRSSGRADLALGWPNGGDNRFAGNDARSSRPSGLDGGGLFAGAGDPWVTMVLFQQFLKSEFETYPRGDWRTAPEPDPQPTMPDPERPPREAVRREAP
ncbi:MAG: plastocyanin [Halobacteriales archaeon]